MDKDQIISGIKRILSERVTDSHKQLDELEIARNSDSKGTAGDKHETGRAMVQLEVDRAREQLTKANDLLASFNQINFDQSASQIAVGNLVDAGNLTFLFGVGLGKIKVVEQDILAISVASPVGQQLLGKKVGDEIVVGPHTLTIDRIS